MEKVHIALLLSPRPWELQNICKCVKERTMPNPRETLCRKPKGGRSNSESSVQSGRRQLLLPPNPAPLAPGCLPSPLPHPAVLSRPRKLHLDSRRAPLPLSHHSLYMGGRTLQIRSACCNKAHPMTKICVVSHLVPAPIFKE